MGRFATGVTVVTTIERDTIHGMTANAFLSVSLRPPLVLVSLGRCRMNEMLPRTGRYGVSVLAHDQEHFAAHFAAQRPSAGRAARSSGTTACRCSTGALAHLVCRVVDVHRAGDHVLWIGEVEHLHHRDGEPLLFYTGRFGTVRDRRQSRFSRGAIQTRHGASRRTVRAARGSAAAGSAQRSGPNTSRPTSPAGGQFDQGPDGPGARDPQQLGGDAERRSSRAVARTASRSSSCGSVAYCGASMTVSG